MDEIRFGPFALNTARRSLSRQGQPVPLGSRAMEILVFLAAAPGMLRSTEEIMRHAWPDTHVEEANLRVHLSAIRKALGDGRSGSQFIANVPGRGYRFIGEVERPGAAHPARQAVGVPGIVGRDEAILAIARLLEGRMVTVVGPGGIGKSTVARAVAGYVQTGAGPLWIDLSELDSGEHLTSTVATAVGLTPSDPDILDSIAGRLAAQGKLPVLDGCEHVVTEVACLVEALHERAPALRILATSREPLRVSGERLYRLSPLEIPAADGPMNLDRPTSAMELFLDRATGFLGTEEPTPEDIRLVGEICHKLDGIALAIELAAARLEAISLRELSDSLDHSFRLLTRGRRNAVPRHRTLRATLDWSYEVLPPDEQAALQNLSVLRGWFSASLAGAVLDDPADELLHELVSKSLVVADVRGPTARYRLLDTTRMYAAEKLAEACRQAAAMSRLAQHLTVVLEANEGDIDTAGDADLRHLAELVPHVRTALSWALKQEGILGARLTAATVPLFFRLALLDECLDAVTAATQYLDTRPGLDERLRMKLYAALGWPQMRPTGGPRAGVSAWKLTLQIAEEIGDLDYQLRALWALWVDAINQAQPLQGMRLAETFATRAAGSPDRINRVVGLRLVAATNHWLGQFEDSQNGLQLMLNAYDALPTGNSATRFQFDQRITARVILTRNLWIMGRDEDAFRMIDETMQRVIDMRHDLSLANYLAEAACPIALLAGRFDLAEAHIDALRRKTRAMALDVWNNYADCFEAELHLHRGNTAACLDVLPQSQQVLERNGFNLFRAYWQSVEAQALAQHGRHADARHVLDEALAACAASGERWCMPELLRVKGLLAKADGAPDARQRAAALFEAAIDAARQDGAEAWARRATDDLAGLVGRLT